MGCWEHFAHESDIGVRGLGASCAEAFEQAAVALTAVVTDPAGGIAATRIELHCEAPDSELLLADWLNAVICEMATRNMLFGRYEVRLESGRLACRMLSSVFSPKPGSARMRPSCAARWSCSTVCTSRSW